MQDADVNTRSMVAAPIIKHQLRDLNIKGVLASLIHMVAVQMENPLHRDLIWKDVTHVKVMNSVAVRMV